MVSSRAARDRPLPACPSTSSTRRTSCVIGSDVARRPVRHAATRSNKEIKIGRYDFRVIGVMEKQGGELLRRPRLRPAGLRPDHLLREGVRRPARRPQTSTSPSRRRRRKRRPDLEYEVIGEMRKIRKLRPTEQDNFSINKLDTLRRRLQQRDGRRAAGRPAGHQHLAVRRRRRRDEHHVRLGHRAHARDRHSQGDRRQSARSILLQFLFESVDHLPARRLIGIVLAALADRGHQRHADAGEPVARSCRRRRGLGDRSAWSPASSRPGAARGSTRSRRCAMSRASDMQPSGHVRHVPAARSSATSCARR